MPDADLEARITELECRQAFQDDTIQALNDVIAAQQQDLVSLQRRLEQVLQRQEELASRVPDAVVETPPPHY